jgi:GNAT superfamily N-acetyltransferase
MSNQLFKDYLKEEEGLETIIHPHGFASFRIQDVECYFAHLYVDPPHRHKGIGQKLGTVVENIAKSRGCIVISCNVFLNKANKHSFAKRIDNFNKFGFKIEALYSTHALMTKEIS